MRVAKLAYDAAGAPYGHTTEGLKRWLAEQKTGAADPRQQCPPRRTSKGL